MTKKQAKEQKILKFAQNSIYDKVKHLGIWQGYDVWEAGFSDDEPRFTGFPQFILARDGRIRWSHDYKESQSIMEELWK